MSQLARDLLALINGENEIGVHGTCLRLSNGYNQAVASSPSPFPKVDFSGTYGEVFFDTEDAADRANSQIIVPSWANWVYVAGHITWANQTNGDGAASCHLFRDDDGGGEAPTLEDLFYHQRIAYPANLGTYISQLATTGLWVPVTAKNEKWSVHAWQNTGGSADLVGSGKELWFAMYFKP